MAGTTDGSLGPQLVVGLGNPGPRYAATRHNLGQAVLDRVAARLGCRFRLGAGAAVAEGTWAGTTLYLAKPVAFMNAMGPGVRRLLWDLELEVPSLVTIYDDLDLPFGRVRVRQRGGHGGHNGVRSLIETLGTEEFRRVKVGIGRPDSRDAVVDWVLAPFTADEAEALPAILERAADAVLALAVTAPEGEARR